MQMKLVAKEYTFKEAFGSEFPDSQTISGYEKNGHAYVPEKDPYWQWDKSLLLDLIIWWKEGGNDAIYLFGPTGAGKSSALLNFCASLGIPLYEKPMYASLEFPELISRTDLVDGTTLTNYASLPLAMGATGSPGIFCANEIDKADDGMLAGLYEVLAGRPLETGIGGSDVVKPVDGFRFAATGNTTLMGDTTGLWVGSKQQDLAFQDRFWKVKVNYPSVEVEESLLEQVAGNLPEVVRKKMVEVANEIREAFMGQSDSSAALPLTMSTRSLVRWAAMTWCYRGAESENLSPIYYALDRAMLNSADSNPEWRKAILTIVQGKMGDDIGVPNV